jgi:Na+/melibiose symporter-like transporter
MRNYRLGVVNGLLYILSETLLDPTLVLIAYLSHITNSPILLGMLLPLRDGSWSLPQLWVSCYLPSLPRKIILYRKLSVVRILSWGSIAVVINFVHQQDLILIAFFSAYTLASLASGLSGLPFLEIVGKTIPAERRGEFFAWRFGLGGLVGIGASILVRWLIDPNGPLPFPQNYGLLSALYFVAASASLLLFNRVEEPPDPVVGKRIPFRQQLKRAVGFLHIDHTYRQFITMQSMMTVAGSATPFFAVFVQQSLGGSKAMVGVYLAVLISTNLLANIFFGRMSRKFGNRRVMVIAMIMGLLMSVLVTLLALVGRPLGIIGRAADWVLVPVFILSGLRGTGIGVAANSLLMDIAPLEERSLYVGFSNTFLGLVMLATFASGLILSLIGFAGLAALTLGAHLLAFNAALRIGKLQPAQPNMAGAPQD